MTELLWVKRASFGKMVARAEVDGQLVTDGEIDVFHSGLKHFAHLSFANDKRRDN